MWAHSCKPLLISSSLVFAVSFLSYWSSLNGDFVFDDHRGVLTNDDLDASKTSLWSLFQHDFWGGPMSRKESHKSYRPLTVLTYRYLNFYFSGLEPYSYHVVNVIFHCIASILVLFLACSILGVGSICHFPLCKGLDVNLHWGLYVALLFAVHSIHTEAVASIVGRAEVLSCIFFLLSLISYFKGVSVGHGSLLAPSHQTKWRYIVASVLFTLCSMLSKEQGIMVIGVCAAFDGILNWEVFWEKFFWLLRIGSTGIAVKKNGIYNDKDTVIDAAGMINSNGVNGNARTAISEKLPKRTEDNRSKYSASKDAMFQGFLKRLGTLAVVGILLMWFRLSMNHDSQPIFKEEELQAVFHPNKSVRILSFSNIYAINAWLLLSPSSLCCDWTLGSIPLVTSVTDSRNVWSLLLYSGIGILCVYVLCLKQNRTAVGMGLALLLLPFLPASGIIFRVGFVIAERVLYVPSLGVCLLVVIGARKLSCFLHYKGLKLLVHTSLMGLIIIMAAKTHTRNKDWASDFKLFESGVCVNPMNVKLRNNYGIELKAAGRVEEARYQYLQSLAIDSNFSEVYMNMGNLLSDEKNYAEALAYFEKAVEFPQMYHKILNNLATTYFRLGRLEEAEVRFKESIQYNPNQPMTYNNLASLYGEMKKYKESEKMFRKALKLNPTYTEAYFNLGTLFIQMGELDKGEKYLKKALELFPQHHGAINNLKVIEHYRRTRK